MIENLTLLHVNDKGADQPGIGVAPITAVTHVRNKKYKRCLMFI